MIDISIIATRDLNDIAIKSVTRRVNMLNQKFFKNVELTEKEQRILIWLCECDEDTISNITSAFEKAK